MRNENNIELEINEFVKTFWIDLEMLKGIEVLFGGNINNTPQTPSSISDDSDEPKSSSPTK